MHTAVLGHALRCGALVLLFLTAQQAAWSQDQALTKLFKIITVKDEIIIGLNADELNRLGGQDAGAVARALAAQGTLTVWQYGVRRGPNGALQQAPTQKIALLAHSSLRVEPYTTPYTVVAHE
jgi:hypothetical protein